MKEEEKHMIRTKPSVSFRSAVTASVLTVNRTKNLGKKRRKPHG